MFIGWIIIVCPSLAVDVCPTRWSGCPSLAVDVCTTRWSGYPSLAVDVCTTRWSWYPSLAVDVCTTRWSGYPSLAVDVCTRASSLAFNVCIQVRQRLCPPLWPYYSMGTVGPADESPHIKNKGRKTSPGGFPGFLP